MDPIAQLLDVAMVPKATLYVSSALVWLVLKLTDNHDRSYKLSLPLFRCLATSIGLVFLDGLHVPTLVHDNEVAVVSQFEFQQEQALPIALNSPHTCRYSLNSMACPFPFETFWYTFQLSIMFWCSLNFMSCQGNWCRVLSDPLLRFGLCVLTVALHTELGKTLAISNILRIWSIFHCKSVRVHFEKAFFDPSTGLGLRWENAF